jgi:hypothetical protein
MQHHNLLVREPNILQIQNTQPFTSSSAEAQFRYRGLFLLPDCESIRPEEYALFIKVGHPNKTIAASTSLPRPSPKLKSLRLQQHLSLTVSQLAATTLLNSVRSAIPQPTMTKYGQVTEYIPGKLFRSHISLSELGEV